MKTKEEILRERRKKPKHITSIDVQKQNFLRYCEEKNLRVDTLKAYTYHIDTLKKYLVAIDHNLDIKEIDLELIRDYLHYLRNERKYSPVSINSVITHLKKFFGFLHEREIIAENPMKKIEKARVDKKPIMPFTHEQLKNLLKAPDLRSFKGWRDYCTMLVLADTGMRVSELLSIAIEDIDFTQNLILLEKTKNRNPRTVGISKKTSKELKEFKNTYLKDFDETDYFFQNERGEKLHKRTLQQNISCYGKEAGISNNIRCSPHTFRHYFAINYLKNGGSTAGLRKILGHLSYEVVENYLEWADTDVVEQCHKYSPINNLEL